MISLQRSALVSMLFAATASLGLAQAPTWIEQFGTTTSEDVWASASDGSGGVYLAGRTFGSLAGPSAGGGDGWFGRYDGSGNALWMRQIGTLSDDGCGGCASDGAGGVYVGGWSAGNLGGPNAGSTDALLARYDGAGNLLWIRQLGAGDFDSAFAVASDGSGGAFLAGSTLSALGGTSAGDLDVWVARYDAAGVQLWIRQLGSSSFDSLSAVTASSSGGVFLAGNTTGAFGGPAAGSGDAFLAHLDAAGQTSWVRQLGTSAADGATALVSDGAGGVFVGGSTAGALGGTALGGHDGWLARYDGTGAQLWMRQFGTSADESLRAGTENGAGGAFVTGHTSGVLTGASAGAADVWLAGYDSSGAPTVIQQFGSNADDYAEGAAPDGNGNVFLTGFTYGALGGPLAGSNDVFVARLDVACTSVPANYCTAKVNSLGCTPAIAMSSAPSASAGAGCTVAATNVVGAVFGIFIHSTSGASSMPFHGGFLCVAAPIRRHGLLQSGGTAGTCTGSFSEQFNAYIASGADPTLVAGAQVWIQNWSRDPAASFSDGLSDAVTATICP